MCFAQLQHLAWIDMSRYICWTGGIPCAHVKQLMRLRTGAHHLAIETGRWQRPTVPRDECVCLRCMRHALTMDCMFYSSALLTSKSEPSMEWKQAVHVLWGGYAICNQGPDAGTRPESMNQEPKLVARFVSECLRL